ncbi:MAG: hypothetical protein QM791_09295 [Ferruginibacter sp.]
MISKQKIHLHYLQLLENKIHALQQKLAELKEMGANETKSTAGDKYETALAMIQIEQENTRLQLRELLEQKTALEKIDTSLQTKHISTGSLVKTNHGWLYLSVALGKQTIDGITITALSPQSPLGKKLLMLKVNDTAAVNNNHFTVEEIL